MATVEREQPPDAQRPGVSKEAGTIEADVGTDGPRVGVTDPNSTGGSGIAIAVEASTEEFAAHQHRSTPVCPTPPASRLDERRSRIRSYPIAPARAA